MKKFLSLLLALTMALSLLTLSVGAETFADSADITYAEAVEVMTAIDIVDGYPDGSFGPAGMLTRGAAAKIICNMVLGPTVAGALRADTAPFPDVPADHVFAGYISYCASQGIINGYTDGTFKPAGDLTGNAFMKMLLGALGYDPIREGYVGENWSISVAKQALSLDLDAGLGEDFNGTKALNRQEAMLYAFNTLCTTMVQYSSETDIVVGGASVTTETDAKAISRTTGTDYRGSRETVNGTMQFCEQYFPELTATETSDPMGRPSTKWFNDHDEIGTFVNTRDLVISVQGVLNKGKLRDYIGQDLSDKIVSGDRSVKLNIFVDGANPTNSTFIPSTLLQKSSTMTISTRWITRSSKTDIFVDKHGAGGVTEVTICIEGPHLYRAVGGYNANQESLKLELVSANEPAPNNLQPSLEVFQEDFNVSGYQDGDYVLITYSHLTDEVQSIAKARTVSGAMTGFLFNTSFELDGTTYYYNGHERVCTDGSGNYHATESSLQEWQNGFVNGNNVTAVLDSRGYVMWIDSLGSDGTSAKYIYVDAFAKTGLLNNKGALIGYLPDGTYVESVVSKIIGTDGGVYEGISYVDEYRDLEKTEYNDVYDKCPPGMWYSYSTSGDNYVLRHLDAPNSSGDYTLVSLSNPKKVLEGKVLIEPKINFCSPGVFSPADITLRANNATVFVLLNPDNEATSYVGMLNIPKLTAANRSVSSGTVKVSAVVDNKTNMAKYVFIDYSETGKHITSDTVSKYDSNYVMILQEQSSWRYISDEEQYVEVSALVDGVQKTIRVLREAGASTSQLETGVLYKNVVVDEEGYYIRGTEVGKEADELGVKNCSDPVTGDNDVLTIGSDTLVLDSTETIHLVVFKKAGAHLSNKGAQFELHSGLSAKALARAINKGDRYSYNYFAALNDDNSSNPTALYIFITDDVEDAANNSPFIQPTTGEFWKKEGEIVDGKTDGLDDSTAKVKDQLKAEQPNTNYCVRVTLNKDAFNPDSMTFPLGGGKTLAAKGKWYYDLKVIRNEDNEVIVNSTGLAPEKALTTSAMSLYGSLLNDAYAETGNDFTVEITLYMEGYEPIYLKHTGFEINRFGKRAIN